jgi:hypothetical protein
MGGTCDRIIERVLDLAGWPATSSIGKRRWRVNADLL